MTTSRISTATRCRSTSPASAIRSAPHDDADAGVGKNDQPSLGPNGDKEAVLVQSDAPALPAGRARKIYVDGVGARTVAERV